ncbi:hypothetical protein CHS0354_012390 [Potamilus streckersoni]|uniref:Uncharacterized protein n=1 Tax=Potamilus streckersoni TaxID=2493646 RepID=A0AAE0RUB1_9BIVA|nr:hypothetical protein CHS0354_012390 [Potamilus streckersoni]
MYFTPRLKTMMKNTGYEIIETSVDDYETLKHKSNIIKLSIKDVMNNPVVDEFLKTSIGDLIKQSKIHDTEKYYKHDPEEKLEPYKAKKSFLNHLLQFDLGKLPEEQVEKLYNNSSRIK